LTTSKHSSSGRFVRLCLRVPCFTPDLRKIENRLTFAVLVKL
jgi:hypothetical protein